LTAGFGKGQLFITHSGQHFSFLFARKEVTMIESTGDPRSGMKIAVGILSAVYAVTFFCGALLHLGVQIPLGAAVLAEPTILPAAIVESLCGLALSIGAWAVLARWNRAWTAVFAAHAFALGGVLLGVSALALGAGPSTDLNTMYHRVMLVGLVAVLALLLTPAGRAAFRREA
jgi:hypothetical protein